MDPTASGKTDRDQTVKRTAPRLGRNVIVLGVVSLFTDISSDMIYPIIPLFLASTLGAPMAAIGLVEGAAEAMGSLLRGLSGYLSDRFKRRKIFVIVGYTTSAAAKPLIALATSWGFVLGARLLDRFGKSVRTSPRDALISLAATREQRGLAFGVHRALDTLGAVGGALLALGLVWYWGVSYRSMFVLACIPAAIGVLICTSAVREIKDPPAGETENADDPPGTAGQRWLTGPMRRFMIVSAIFALANSSNVFIILRAKDLGFSDVTALWGYVLFSITAAVLFIPAGTLSDKLGRKAVLCTGYLVYAAVYFGLAFVKTQSAIWIVFAIYGIFESLTHGVSKAYVSDLTADMWRGTALGAVNAVEGLGMLVASLLMGVLWQLFGAPVAFIAAASLASMAAILLLVFRIPTTVET